ncbi:beta-galactosidase, partial [Streptococcus pyogenes]
KQAKKYADISLTGKVSLFNCLEDLSQKISSFYPLNMEELGQSTGYILYQTLLERDKEEAERFRIIDGRDRIQVYRDREWVATQYQEEIGEDIA